MARRRRGPRDETEMTSLLDNDGENDDADFQHTVHTVLSTVEEHHENPSTQYGTLTQATGRSTSSTENLRFIVLGSDSNRMNKVLAFLLGKSQAVLRCRPGICELRQGHVHNRHVSVVTTPVNWLERLKSFWFFKNAVRSLKNEMEFCESLVFPGPHVFLLVIDDNSDKELCLLNAIKEAFGQEALDYSMVLVISESYHNQTNNPCVKACGDRYHILNSTNQNLADLFLKVEAMTKNKKNKCFIRNFEFFTKVSAHLHEEYKTEYEEKEGELLRKLTVMNKTVQDLKTELDRKDAMLQKEIQKGKALEQKLTEALLTREQPRTAQRTEDEREGTIEPREEDLQASGSQTIVRVRRGSMEIDQPNMSESKNEREGETKEKESQISGSQTLEGLQTLRQDTKEMDPPDKSKSEHGHLFVL